jgi:hypothetical protein
MANELNVSPATILASSTSFADVGDTARTINENLDDQLNGLGPLAGHDDYGAAFEQVFLPAINASRQVLLGVRDGMNLTVQNLQNTAHLYNNANEVNTDLSNGLASP